MQKRGAELSINVIIVAVLGLLVLLVLIFVVSGKLGDFRRSVDTCPSQQCVGAAKLCNDPSYPVAIPMDCDANAPGQEYCCQSLGKGR